MKDLAPSSRSDRAWENQSSVSREMSPVVHEIIERTV